MWKSHSQSAVFNQQELAFILEKNAQHVQLFTHKLNSVFVRTRGECRAEAIHEVLLLWAQFSMTAISKGVKEATVYGGDERVNMLLQWTQIQPHCYKDCILVMTAVWFSPQATCLMPLYQRCSSGFGKSTCNRNVPWPSWPYWPLPNVYTHSSEENKTKENLSCTVIKAILGFTSQRTIHIKKKTHVLN